MTNEEAIKHLKWFSEYNEDEYCGGDRIQKGADWYYYINKEDFEAFDVAIKALEQEPCEDCISRKALLEEIENGIKAGNYEEGYEEYPHINDMNDIIECVKYAESVQPKPKTGHWKKLNVGYGCSECSLATNKSGVDFYRFCPNCGAKMESEG